MRDLGEIFQPSLEYIPRTALILHSRLLPVYILLQGWSSKVFGVIERLLRLLVMKSQHKAYGGFSGAGSPVSNKPSYLSKHQQNSSLETLLIASAGNPNKREALHSSHKDVSRHSSTPISAHYAKISRLSRELDQSLDLAMTIEREALILAKLHHDRTKISQQFSETAVTLYRAIKNDTSAFMTVPRSVRRVARTIATASEDERLEIAFCALREMVDWMLSSNNPYKKAASSDKKATSDWPLSSKNPPKKAASSDEKTISEDELRSIIVNRRDSLAAALPESLRWLASEAFMHIEHEVLRRQYINKETMVMMEPVQDIPRDRFWASEDGYAFDMEELVEALDKGGAGGGGAMRNPLSLQLFTTDDVASIIKHPLGRRLAILQDKQSELQRGLSAQTVTALEKVAEILSRDDTDTQQESHEAVGQWIAYLARLSKSEVDALNELKIPAVDSHTRLRFNATVGEMINDVQGNRVCNHKAGDFLSQAVKFLRE